ncbi:Flotillin-like [Forsythia ovata]|uniref:Flotillin-like n=1 Tax=Forsythia ovata TaxID=205694 RepID=A0ABD1WG78_9LAMI
MEPKIQEANWELYKKQKSAEAYLYEKEKEAQAQKAAAGATFYGRQQIVDGELYSKKKEAKGLIAIAEAQGIYVRGRELCSPEGLLDDQWWNVSRNSQDQCGGCAWTTSQNQHLDKWRRRGSRLCRSK